MQESNKGGGEDVDKLGLGCSYTGISTNAGLKIIANVNSHQFLPKLSPLSLQQAFTLQKDTVMIQPIYKGFIVYTHTVNITPKGKTSTRVYL